MIGQEYYSDCLLLLDILLCYSMLLCEATCLTMLPSAYPSHPTHYGILRLVAAAAVATCLIVPAVTLDPTALLLPITRTVDVAAGAAVALDDALVRL